LKNIKPILIVIFILVLLTAFFAACELPGDETSDISPPVVPGTPGVYNSNGSDLYIIWNIVETANSYDLYRADTETGTYTSVQTGIVDTSYYDTNLVSKITYWYKILASNSAGASELSGSAGRETNLGIPLISVSNPTQTTLTISWPAVNGATSYKIIAVGGSVRSPNATIATISETSYVDTGLESEETYSYAVTAQIDSEHSLESDRVSGTTLPPGAPNIPTLTVGNPTATSLNITWTAEADTTSYEIYRDTSSGGTFPNKVYEGRGTSFINSGLSSTTTYYYKVRGLNGSSPSDFSSIISEETGSVPQTSTYTLEFTTETASATFGCRLEPTPKRTFGVGQSVTLDQTIILDSFAFDLGTLTQLVASSIITIRLDLRDSTGNIIITNGKTVTDHSSGWFIWDGFTNITLSNGSTYIFTAYVMDALENEATASIAYNDDVYPGGIRYGSHYAKTDLEDWTNYIYNDYSSYDMNFQIKGH